MGDVHLLAPGRTLTARDMLVALFETMPAPAPATTSTAATTTVAPRPATRRRRRAGPRHAATGPPAAGRPGLP